MKRPLGMDVLTAARRRISVAFDECPRVYVSFSGGKDSTVMLHLVVDEAISRGRKVGVLFVDLEGQYRLTIDHVQACYDLYRDHIDPYWVALPIHLRNAVSQFQSHWVCWDSNRRADWIREPPAMAITTSERFPFFRHAMEFEEFTPEFGWWFSGGERTACFVGIRADESLNRYRTMMGRKSMLGGLKWTTDTGKNVYNIYPIYDWKTEDIWTYHARFPDRSYNRLYDLMWKAGLTIHQSRICQPYGDDQRKGLWLFHLIEPETWARVVARVNGANGGALYAQESGNILGRIKISRPHGHTWQSFASLLLSSMPTKTQAHFSAKIDTFLYWWFKRGYQSLDGIPDEADPKQEAARKVPSWRRICKALLRYDYWCKGLSFSQTQSAAYQRWKRQSKERDEERKEHLKALSNGFVARYARQSGKCRKAKKSRH